MRAIDLTGRSIGRVVVLGRRGTVFVGNSERFAWLCRCECGNECVLSSSVLLKDKSTSCGCKLRPNTYPETLDGLFARSIPEPNSGCMLWFGSTNQFGYARVKINGIVTVAHRVAYTLAKGDVPPGLELDHLCRVRCCINPDHLEPVTKLVNVRRGVSGAVNRARLLAISANKRGKSA